MSLFAIAPKTLAIVFFAFVIWILWKYKHRIFPENQKKQESEPPAIPPSPTKHFCPQCGKELPARAPEGLCPGCVMRVGLGSQPGTQSNIPPAMPPSPDNIAKHFPQLEILELLGRGGMGVVYKARQPKLNRFVALKILTRDADKTPQFAERFQREAQALARLNHPNIVTVHDFGEAGGFYYLLMEFVDGVNLRELLRAQKIKPEEALKIVPPICEALQFAHDQGIVHRDIKPENILLDKQGRVKIADFGIAKILGADKPTQPLTGEQQSIGTPHYMAPEQVEKPTTVDHRADIYSLGVVFYEMLTGELPLGRFAPPSARMGGIQIDVRLDEIVLRALEKEPERRYQQVSEVKTCVETIVTGLGSARGSRAEPGVAPGRAERELKRGGILLVGRRNGQRVIVWRGVMTAFFAILGCCLIGILIFRLFTPIGAEGLITAIFLAVLITTGGLIVGIKTPVEQLTALDDSQPDGSRREEVQHALPKPRFSRWVIVGVVLTVFLLTVFWSEFASARKAVWNIFIVLGIIFIFMLRIWRAVNRPLKNAPIATAANPARTNKNIWIICAALSVILLTNLFQWWSKYEPAGVWIPVPINDSISGKYGEALIHITDVSQRGQIVVIKITCETPYPDRGLFVQYSGPTFDFPAGIALEITNLDCLVIPTFLSAPGGGKALSGSNLLKEKSVYQIGFVLPDATTAAKVVEQVTKTHLGKPRGLDQKDCVLELFFLHKRVGEKINGQPVIENLVAMLDWQPKIVPAKNSKSASTFSPVIERMIDMAKPGGYDLDNSKFNEVALEEMVKDGKSVAWSKKFGNDLILLIPTGTNASEVCGLNFVDMKPTEVEKTFWNKSADELRNHPRFTEMLAATIKQEASPKSKVWWWPARMPHDPSDTPTYLFKTREGSMGILQITDFTDKPRSVKIRYKLVQSLVEKVAVAPSFPVSAQSTATFNPVMKHVPDATPQTKPHGSALQFRLVAGDNETNAPADLLPDNRLSNRKFRVLREVLLDGSAISQAGVDFSPIDGSRIIEIRFTDAGAKLFKQITTANIHRQLAIVFRSNVLSAPMIASAISGGRGQISGSMDASQIHEIVDYLNLTTVPTDKAWNFAPPCERILPPKSHPEPLFGWLDLDSGMVLTNSPLDWRSHAGHEWIRTNSLDVVTTDSSKKFSALLGIDMILAPTPTNGWDTITAADVVHNWTLLEEEPQQKQIIPGRSDTFFFQTREGGKGILQILGFSENPHGVKIRYKLVQSR